jgi:hypothetical protein
VPLLATIESVPLDPRRPAEVTADFRARLSSELTPHGFVPRRLGATFVRRQKHTTHRIELASSHRNVPGDVTCWVRLLFEDRQVQKRADRWTAGGQLGLGAFPDPPPSNIADPDEADALLARVLRTLDFFSLLEDAARAEVEVCRRYVPGLIEPGRVVPYLLAHCGEEAVSSYASALLQARPELWPAFVGRMPASGKEVPLLLDHGTALARELAGYNVPIRETAPADTAEASDLRAAGLRSHFGLQLRAWGEPEAAALLRRVDDERVRVLNTAQKERGPLVDDIAGAEVLLEELGEQRPPRRQAPSPRLFQYYALHPPFASWGLKVLRGGSDAPASRTGGDGGGSPRGHRIRKNGELRGTPSVDVIASSGEKLGVMTLASAMKLALQEGLDLVEINPRADPPVCKILDLSEYNYAEKRKAALARRKDEKPEGE